MVMKMGNIRNYNVTIFGDSIPKGVSINEGKVIKVEKNAVNLLEEHYDININNKSFFGQTLKRVYDKNMIDSYLSSINNSMKNVLVISLGGNDSDYDWPNVAKDPFGNHTSKTPIEEFKRILREIIVKVKKNDVKVILTNLFPVDSYRYFENIIARNNDREAILKFLNNDISNISRHQECFNDTITDLGKELNVRVLDVRTNFLLNTRFLETLSFDGIHPNALGQIEIANELIKQIDLLM